MKLNSHKNLSAKFLTGIIFLVIIAFFLACEKNDIPESDLVVKDGLIYKKGSRTPFTGREKARVENKIIEYDIVDGIKHGEFLLYYEDGTLEIKGTIERNKNVNKWQYFYPDGSLESEGYFVDDRPEGRWIWLYPGGQLKEEGSYHKGKRIGWWRQFDTSGNVIFKNKFETNDSLATGDSTLTNYKTLPF
jgi:antitoxin component YwqK of YwqJK toxin-antitoxin module